MKRGSGILMHIASLPDKYGIGTLGNSAYKFVDFLLESGQKYWQILPIGPTGYGDSPYQSFSTFAGNPYFIDLTTLIEEGSLTESDCSVCISPETPPESIDYEHLFSTRFKVLKTAFSNDRDKYKTVLADFRKKHSYWIESYALYMSVKFKFGLKAYTDWNEDIKLKKPEVMSELYTELSDEIDFWIYVQYQFYRQWDALKHYANQNCIKIIGDIPIYVAEDSADAWAFNQILMLDDTRTPIKAAGCPPDVYAPKGQLWGNPLYDWKYLKKNNYDWWIKRIENASLIYDIIRIDHFRGLESFYAIPYGSPDAVDGEWIKGPGKDFFDALKRNFGDELSIIAEDLGTLTKPVRELLKYSGYPGMKVMQFGFEPGEDSEYLPHNYEKNSVAYIGTHDNDTLLGWLEEQTAEVREFARSYVRSAPTSNVCLDFICTLLSSPAEIAIITMQDLLSLGSEARINTPSTLGGNWKWRMKSFSDIPFNISEWLKSVCKTYSR